MFFVSSKTGLVISRYWLQKGVMNIRQRASSVVNLLLLATTSGDSDSADEDVSAAVEAWVFDFQMFCAFKIFYDVPWYSMSGHGLHQRVGWLRIAMAPRVKLMLPRWRCVLLLRLLTPTVKRRKGPLPLVSLRWSLKRQPPTRMGHV